MVVELMLAVMMTPFGEKVTAENAWRNHPRPQLMHCGEGNVMNILNGDWDYAITSVTNTPGRPTEWQGKIRVPFALESALSGVGKKLEPGQFLWYARRIHCVKIPGEFLTHAMLDFTRRYDPTRLVNGPSGCWDWEGGHHLPKGWAWTNRVETAHKPAGECESADTVDMHLYRGPTMFAVNDRRISFFGEFGGLMTYDRKVMKFNPAVLKAAHDRIRAAVEK